MTQNSVKSGEFRFSVDSSLLFQLGEQLVTRSSIALAELVKNAYDADATKATIMMKHVEQLGGTIVVEDNGHGMTFEEMQDSWMRIPNLEKPLGRLRPPFLIPEGPKNVALGKKVTSTNEKIIMNNKMNENV